MLKIKEVEKESVGEDLGFEPGDAIVKIDGYKVVDLLDYMYYDAQSEFTLSVLTKDGDNVTIEVEKDEDDSLGLVFENDGLEIRTCHNDCIFCFVRQMPKGMRESLYVKDDDYRQSFLCGNFITLTNVSDEEIERIIRLKLSPLYISVHAMDGEMRKKMMNNRFADRLESQLKRLEEGGITIHAQVVLVKGFNDGKQLDYTIDKLYSFKNIKTAAVVPCGITKFRDGLYPIEDMDGESAKNIIKQVEEGNKRNHGNLVRLADELYLKAGLPLPPYESYGDFCQVENGIGMSVKFRRDVEEIVKLAKEPVLKPGKYLSVSGPSIYKFMNEIVSFVEKSCKDVEIKLVPIENKFFGNTVNCTGLLTGTDIYNALKDMAKDYDVLLIPNPCLMQFEDKFLDDWTLEKLGKKLGIRAERAFLKD